MADLSVVWTAGASNDFLSAQSDQADEVGFVYGIDSALSLLKSFPEMGSKVTFLERHRRILVGKRREFGIYYTVVGDRLIVSAMVNLRQSPEAIVELLKGRGAL
ncbi:MAG: hypothetical protein AAF236_14595 [Verrucomicrobiota bacterium]